MGDIPDIRSVDDLFYAKDIRSLRGLCKAWNVDVTGCKDLKDIKKRLIGHFIKNKQTGSVEVRLYLVFKHASYRYILIYMLYCKTNASFYRSNFVMMMTATAI